MSHQRTSTRPVSPRPCRVLLIGLICLAALTPLVSASPYPTPTPNPDVVNHAPAVPTATHGPGLLARLIMAKRGAAEALTVYQPMGEGAAQFPKEIIPPWSAQLPSSECDERCEDFGKSVKTCDYKPNSPDVNSTCICKNEVQKQMFVCFECEMIRNERPEVWKYYVALSDRLIGQCERDNQPVNLTHYALWQGWKETRGVSGNLKQTYVTRAFFQPSGARARVSGEVGLAGVVAALGVGSGLVWSLC